VNPDIRVITGSFHPTFCAEEVMQNPDIDFVVRGEGEIPLTQLVKEIKKDQPKYETVRGIHYRDSDNQVRGNPPADMIPDLDQLPLPARDLVLDCDFTKYYSHSLSATRGCPYSCAFCGDRSLWGGTVRRRSVEKVVEEMAYLEDTYKTNYVEIIDGTFTFDRKYLQDFCNTIIDRNLEIRWGCTARYDNLDEGILKLMKKANCWGLYIGLESGSNRVLKSINKKETVERDIEVTKMIRDSGIFQATSILLGSPDEEKEDIEETLKIMKNFKTDFYDVNSYLPLPGTPFYDAMSKEEKAAVDWRKVGIKSFANYFSKHMTKEELERYQSEAYRITNSLRKRSILRLGSKMAVRSMGRSLKKLVGISS
jgi:anaerobic magnesium-protoporphyrin IX monomethyl ester cyclase